MAAAVHTAMAEDGSLRLFTDYAAFKYEGDDSGRSYVEVYYNIVRNDLKYFPDSLGYSAIMDFQAVLYDSAGAIIDSVSWKAGSRISSLSVLDDNDYLISDLFAELFLPGNYTIEMKVKNNENSGMSTVKMKVPEFSGTDLTLSSIEWAYDISVDSVGKLVKYGRRVVPNACGRYSEEDGAVYLYAEAYNLDNSPGADSSYSLAMHIYDSQGNLYKSINPTYNHKPGNSAVIITGCSIAALDGGLYRLKLVLTDGDRIAEAEKTFTVMMSPESARNKIMQAILSQYPGANEIRSDDDARKFKNDIAYIAAPEELRLFDSLNLEGKKNFQNEFWEGKDPDTSTPVNEYKLEHYRRLKYVDERFTRMGGTVPGWKTDQGRVYVLYGEPSEIERSQSSIQTRSWEKWWYHGLEGGVYFIFVDYEDTDTYVLIHSTKQNEIKDENWENKINMTAFQR
jgi:GWxTD domain-containing protein